MVRKRLPWLAAALVLGACRDETTSGPAAGLAPSFHRDGGGRDALQFSAWSAPVNLGPPVNTASLDQGASISRNGLSLSFHSDRPGGFGGQDIWVSQRASVGGPWGPPQNLGPPVNTSSNEQGASLTLDGGELYFFSDRPGGLGGNDLYVARRRNRRDDFGWQAPVNLGSGVNSDAGEMQPEHFEDDETEITTLYFTSNRLGGVGGDDIYASTLQADETFGPAVLVPELSTESIDRQPAIRRDGLEMFLASDRPGTLGALDLWVSTRATTSGSWSPPVNLGSVVNTTVVDAFPSLSFQGTEFYFQSPRPGGLGMFDLYVSTRTRLFQTVLVDPNGRGDATAKTIQEGITMVAPGGRVRVAPGTYHEQVTVSKDDLVIVAVEPDDDHDDDDDDRRRQGRAGGEVVVDAHGHDFGFLVHNASGVTIQGFRVEQAHEADIALDGATFTTIRKNVTSAAGHDGIQLFASNDNVIEHNVAADNLAPNACGVNVFGGSKRNVVRKNRLVNNEYGIQIVGATTLDNVIAENRALRNRGNGIRNIGGAAGTVIERTSARENGRSPSPVTGATAAGIRIGTGMGVVVRGNRIVDNAQAGLRLGPDVTTPIDARCNWWGSASGPSGTGLAGTGDAIVVATGAAAPGFAPWATDDDDNDDDDRAGCGRESEWSEPVHLGDVVNSAGFDANGSLSADGLRLYFQSDRAGGVGGTDLWVSRRASLDRPWEPPVNLGPVVNSTSGDAAASLSTDGRLLFFQSNRPGGQGDADIYVSRRTDPNDDLGWGPPVNLGPQVNTAAPEQGVEYFESPAGTSATLFFNRGLLAALQADLYAAPMTRSGEPLGPAEPLVELNAPGANDAGASVRADGREILFWSTRAGTFGLADVWVSTRRRVRDPWSPPVNLGAPLNTRFSENRPNLSQDGRTLFFDSNRPGGVGGSQDLWMSTRTPIRSGDHRDR